MRLLSLPMTSYATKSGGVPKGKLSLILAVVALSLITANRSRGDQFDRLEGPPLFDLLDRPDAHAHNRLTTREIEALPSILADERGPFILVKTNLGNLAKILVSSGFRARTPAIPGDALAPVLILERFETIDAGDRRSSRARGKELTLFEGFEFDLDAGQVVPPGFGGDITFSAQDPDAACLATLNGSRVFTLERPLKAPSPGGQPSGGRAVKPTDFDGRYSLSANGQWSGWLTLAVDDGAMAAGHFRSDRNGTSYAVSGKVAGANPQKISFTIKFPRAEQTYEGFLFSEGKNVIAGTVSMLDRSYGFVAVRDGASLSLSSGTSESSVAAAGLATEKCRVVVLQPGSAECQLDGQTLPLTELTRVLSQSVQKQKTTTVRLCVSDAAPFERVRRVSEMILRRGRHVDPGGTSDQRGNFRVIRVRTARDGDCVDGFWSRRRSFMTGSFQFPRFQVIPQVDRASFRVDGMERLGYEFGTAGARPFLYPLLSSSGAC